MKAESFVTVALGFLLGFFITFFFFCIRLDRAHRASEGTIVKEVQPSVETELSSSSNLRAGNPYQR